MRVLLVLLLALTPAPLRLEASTARSDFMPGDSFTVSAHLFNDGGAAIDGALTIAAPPGFVALDPGSAAGTIPPGRALGANWGYEVAPDAPKGLTRFVVSGGGMVRVVVVRVGPVVAAAPVPHRAYLPAIR